MGPTDLEINPGYLREMLNVMKEFGVGAFKCAQFEVAFEVPMEPEPEDDEEKPSTDLVGFVAPSQSDEADEEDIASMHRTALRGMLPTLAPKAK